MKKGSQGPEIFQNGVSPLLEYKMDLHLSTRCSWVLSTQEVLGEAPGWKSDLGAPTWWKGGVYQLLLTNPMITEHILCTGNQN